MQQVGFLFRKVVQLLFPDAVDAPVGSDPEVAHPIVDQLPYVGYKETGCRSKSREVILFQAEQRPGGSADPERAVGLLIKRADRGGGS